MGIGAYEPFWIDNQDRRLYGAMHHSPASRGGQTAALLIPPLLHEQPRSHRFLCEMASCLSESGIPCLRFAYFGTGDSDGDGEQADFASMASDIGRAMQALHELSGCATVVAIAYRSGALPLNASLRGGLAPRAVVLWDPVLDGSSWLREMEQADMQKREALGAQARDPGIPEFDGKQLMGYAVPESLRAELASERWTGAALRQDMPVWSVLHAGQGEGRARTLALPGDMPAFGAGVFMDSTLMLSPRLEQVVRQLGDALLAGY